MKKPYWTKSRASILKACKEDDKPISLIALELRGLSNGSKGGMSVEESYRLAKLLIKLSLLTGQLIHLE